MSIEILTEKYSLFFLVIDVIMTNAYMQHQLTMLNCVAINLAGLVSEPIFLLIADLINNLLRTVTVRRFVHTLHNN